MESRKKTRTLEKKTETTLTAILGCPKVTASSLSVMIPSWLKTPTQRTTTGSTSMIPEIPSISGDERKIAKIGIENKFASYALNF